MMTYVNKTKDNASEGTWAIDVSWKINIKN